MATGTMMPARNVATTNDLRRENFQDIKRPVNVERRSPQATMAKKIFIA